MHVAASVHADKGRRERERHNDDNEKRKWKVCMVVRRGAVFKDCGREGWPWPVVKKAEGLLI